MSIISQWWWQTKEWTQFIRRSRKLIIINLLPFAQVCGMLPSNLFLRISNRTKESPKLCKHWGSGPLELFSDNSRTWRELRLQINLEIFPMNELCDAWYCKVEDNGIGSDPWILLDERSKMARLVHGRRMGCWPRLVRKLSERLIDLRLSLLMFQTHSGTWPWILLPCRSSTSNSFWFARKFGNLLKLHRDNPILTNFWRVLLALVSLSSNDTWLLDRHNVVDFTSFANLSNSTVPLK